MLRAITIEFCGQQAGSGHHLGPDFRWRGGSNPFFERMVVLSQHPFKADSDGAESKYLFIAQVRRSAGEDQ